MAPRDREILFKLVLCLPPIGRALLGRALLGWVLLGVGMAGWGLAGCGPIEYVNQVTRHADNAVESARAADAEKRSPYWWTRAVEYLHQARVEAADADFQAANRFGRLATEAADHAREESLAPAAASPPAPAAIQPAAAPAAARKPQKLAPAVDEATP